MLKFEPSQLQFPMLHSGSSTAMSFTYYTKCTRTFNFCEIFKRAFKIMWPQAHKYVTNTLPQCSPASVGLAQARPNYAVSSNGSAHNYIKNSTIRLACVGLAPKLTPIIPQRNLHIYYSKNYASIFC